MQTRVLGRTGLTASAVAFGGIMVSAMEQPEANALVAGAVERGINYFDVAPSYGNAQAVLGPALEPHRKNVLLACKSGEKTAEGVRREMEESLRLLRTDHFDLYQLHGCDDGFDTVFSPGGAMEEIERARKAGKVRFVGFSAHRERSALYLMSQFDFDTVMQPVNWANTLLNGKSELSLQLAAQKGMGLLGLKALAYRRLGDREPKHFQNCWYMPIVHDERLAELALRYTLSRVHLAVSPGSAQMLELMLKLLEKPGALEAPDASELACLKGEAAKVEAIFPD